MTPYERGKPGDVGGVDVDAGAGYFAQGFLHVDGVPVYHSVESEPQRAELLLLALTQRAPDFPTLAQVNAATQTMAQFLPVELNEDSAAERRVVDIVQDVQGFYDPPKLGQSFCEGRRTILDLQHPHDTCSLEVAEFERPCQADQIVPVFDDQADVDCAVNDGVEWSVAGVFVDPPQPRAADVGQARAEPVSQQPEQPKIASE